MRGLSQTAHLLIQDEAGSSAKCMLVSSIPVSVPALPSLLCDLQHLPFLSSQTPVSSHMERSLTLTDKSHLLGFVPTQLHHAALWQSGDYQVCVCVSTPVTSRGTELVTQTLPSPTVSCALGKRAKPIPRAKPSGTLCTWILLKKSHPGQLVPGRAPRVERRRKRQRSVWQGSCLYAECVHGFALLGRQTASVWLLLV